MEFSFGNIEYNLQAIFRLWVINELISIILLLLSLLIVSKYLIASSQQQQKNVILV